MIIREMLSVPNPEDFMDLKRDDIFSFFIDTEESEDVLNNMQYFKIACAAIKYTDNGASVIGELTFPPDYEGNLALLDIDWDKKYYSGKVAIAGFENIDFNQ